MSATIRENLLVTMGLYAGDMLSCDAIRFKTVGNELEDELADFCVDCVDHYLNAPRYADVPFCEYAEIALLKKFGCNDDPCDYEEDVIIPPKKPTHRVIASAGRVEKVLMEGSYADCEFFCDDFNWEWSEVPGGFVWDLEVEEI